jgi:glycosyltransferase involved in cell wall biosynthesis
MISIVIAVSNNENTIVECVNSVLTQNFNKYEVILVLNNSSDNTKSIIEKNF